jgi:uncharacterized membrane protein
MTQTMRGVLVERPRISAIDIMRGLVMVIMALDHTRDFFHADAMVYDPTDLSKTTPVLFFTRWITHFCAPTFVFLAGTAIHISGQKKSKKELQRFLLTRGLWLILLEVVVVRFGILFNLYYDVIIFQVIWAIGATMVLLGLCIYLKDTYILALGILITLCHNLMDAVTLTPDHPMYVIWLIFFRQGPIALGDSSTIMVFYPLLAWFGIMAMGYGLGRLYTKDMDVLRPTYLVLAGVGAILLFIILRYVNLYGDPKPWQSYNTFTYTLLSFLNCTKYPPSLLYTLMTLGPLLIFLGILDRVDFKIFKPLIVFGRVPLFYYIIHFYLIHAVALFFYIQKTGKSLGEIDFHFSKGLGGITEGYGLPMVYLAWACIVVFLYPLCHWYNQYKSTNRSWWVSYI